MHGVGVFAAPAVNLLRPFGDAKFGLAWLVVAPAGARAEMPPPHRAVHDFHDVLKVAFDVSDDVGGVFVACDGADVDPQPPRVIRAHGGR